MLCSRLRTKSLVEKRRLKDKTRQEMSNKPISSSKSIMSRIKDEIYGTKTHTEFSPKQIKAAVAVVSRARTQDRIFDVSAINGEGKNMSRLVGDFLSGLLFVFFGDRPLFFRLCFASTAKTTTTLRKKDVPLC